MTSPGHPKHAELLDILRSPVMNHPAINMEMLMPLLPEVVASEIKLPLLRTTSRRESQRLLWSAVDVRRAVRPTQS